MTDQAPHTQPDSVPGAQRLDAPPAKPTPPPSAATPKWLCPFFQAVGIISTGLGILGMFVPGLPTTVFLIVALWAFSRSSDRLKLWLWNHPTFGPGLRAWHLHSVIPMKAKISAVTVMALSLVILVALRDDWLLPALVAAVMVPVATWICTRRSQAPAEI
ncbi:MAG: YbaN family protein [Rhodospirillaceae bacterium]|nr:YbaN family protein [Rhodospirillaceae bacterium]